MAETNEQRPNSDVERALWFASLEPTQPDVNFEDFKAGLGASEEIFTTIQELIAQAYYNNGLDNETLLPSGPDFRDAVTEAMTALIVIFETVPAQWLKLWIEALLLDTRNKDRAKKEEVREGKKSSPALADSPTAGKDAPRISQLPPPKSPLKAIEPRQPRPPPIEEKIFGLEVFPADQHKLTLFRPSVVETTAVRCVPRGRDPKQVENYQLELFIQAFEEILNTDPNKAPYEIAHGKLVYYYRKSGSHIGLGKGTRRAVTNQQDFETGVRYLLTSTHRDTLTFTFYQETTHDREKRIPGSSKIMKGMMIGELGKLTVDEAVAGSPRRLSYRERIGATVHPKGKETWEALPTSSDRKQSPGQSSIPRKVWGQPYKGKPQQDTSKRKPAPAGIHVPKAGSSVKPAKEPKDPSPEKLTDPVSKPLPPTKTRAELYPVGPGDGQFKVWNKPRENRPYPPSVSTPAKIDRIPLNPPYGSILYPGARTPPPLRRKKAVIKAVTDTIYTGKRLKAVLTGTSTHPENAALFSPDPNHRKPDKEEEFPGRKSVTPRISQEQHRIRQETGFHPQSPSPAVKRQSTMTSRISARTSISFPPVANIKNIFKRGSKDITPVEEVVDITEDFYAEISRKTSTRGGEKESELSIQRVKEISQHERKDDSEVEEPEETDDFENPDGYLATRLQSLQNMKELSQIRPKVDFARWIDCCRLFDIKPENTEINSTVELAGLKTQLYQYQAYAVYWQMKTSRTVGGGFVADEAGLGKTLSFLAYIVAERQLSWLWDEVETTRAANGPRHRKKDEPEQTRSLPCPTSHERPGWIACPCSASSPTSQWAAKGGVRLACVPQSLVISWISQWNIHIDTTEEHLALRLIVAHDAANPIPAPAFGNADARHARNFNEVRAKRNVADSKGNKYNTESPRRHQERYLVLTTPQSYKTWVKKFEYEGFFLSFAKSINEPTWVKGKSRGIVFGLAMVDECHEEYIKEKGRSGVLSDLPLINNPFIWGYSGTPLGNTPRSLEGVLWAIEQHFPRNHPHTKTTGWDEDPILSQYHYRALNIICKDFEKQVKNCTGNQIVAQKLEDDFTPFLFRFMIRRTADSTWFGRPLIKLKKHIHQDVFLAHNPKFDAKLADLQKVIEDEVHEKYTNLIDTWKVNDPMYQKVDYPRHVTFNQRCRVEWRLRVIATFPALVPLTSIHHKHHLALTAEEVRKYKGSEVYKSPYSLYLKHITSNSAKCIWLKQYILELLSTQDIDGEDQKLVIMTQFNSVALILKLFIERLVLPKDKKNRVGLVGAGMKSRERTAIIDAFTDATDKDTGLRKQKNNIQILIGTTRLIGVGLQLTRAANLVLMEPDYEFYRELQAVARVHRIGQRNLRSYSFRLIDEGSEIENRIVKRQEQRGEVHGREVQTKLISEVVAEQQEEEMNSGAGLMIVDEEVRAGWTREHEELLEQYPVPPAESSNAGPSEGSTTWTGTVNAANEGEYDDIYDADVGR